jgi:hypothetical protein
MDTKSILDIPGSGRSPPLLCPSAVSSLCGMGDCRRTWESFTQRYSDIQKHGVLPVTFRPSAITLTFAKILSLIGIPYVNDSSVNSGIV